MVFWLLLWAQLATSTPGGVVARFYTLYIKHNPDGFFLRGEARTAMLPLLSERFRRQVEDGEACEADWVRQHPEPSPQASARVLPPPIEKPPFVDCCLFSSVPDGMPTSFTLGPTRLLSNGRYRVVVNFVRRDTSGAINWRDAVILTNEGDRLAIDDVVFDADRKPIDPTPPANLFQGCGGRRWTGGL